MGPHAQHYSPAPAESRKTLSPLKAGLVLAIAVGGAHLVLQLLAPGEPTPGTPVSLTRIEVTPLPQLEEVRRENHARLRDWRAGYEAAVDNGCQLRPTLSSPIGLRP
jgi:hypothetical protein